ncbi:MAG: stage III sporulation AC/AD family protein [Oscillospiraceae bacterium]|nr:stage III sporulation AC/AD family protein [Oscillospiraceae bacterium]
MELLTKAIAACVITAIFAFGIKKTVPDLAFGLQLIGVVLVLLLAFRLLTPLISFFRNASSLFGASGVYAQPILKAALIGILTNIGCALCKDAGQTASASALELTGTASIFLAALPLLELFVHTIGDLL